ncbi:MAG: 50S ribosomal protein L22 [Malacoplasma sp.]|nr:50S ribosomal protein L22 [Malacoplasma sp.]
MTTTVKQQAIHISSQKANLVCDLVRYKNVKEATVILDNTPNKAARYIKKLLHSAVANATNNHAMIANNLYIYQITANQGKTLKRMIPRAKGSGSSIRKRFVTLVITLSDDKEQKAKDLQAIKARLAKRNQSKLAKKVETHKETVKKDTKRIKLVAAKKEPTKKIEIPKEGAKK